MITLKDELARVELGSPASFRSLTITPVFRSSALPAVAEYDLLEEAVGRGLAQVTEIDKDGSVPELQFHNLGDRPVLLLDGEELVGAKQNRVVNLTILVGAKQSLRIPVSCVEAGRWHMQQPEFCTSDQFMYATGRARRTAQVTDSLRATGARRSNQSEVWAGIDELAARLDADSPSNAMNAIFERHANTIEQYLRAFKWQPRQAGIMFSVGSATLGLDLFDHPETLRKLYSKLIRSYALDALDADLPPDGEGGQARAMDFLHQLQHAPAFAEPAIGLGKDVRLQAAGLSGAALWAGERYVHICAFATGNTAKPDGFTTRINRPSGRRRR
jgi:hypothetical protein